MTTAFAIRTLIEIAAVLFVIFGVLHEQKFIDFESAVEYASHILHLQETVLYFGKADGYEKSRAGKTFLGGETHV